MLFTSATYYMELCEVKGIEKIVLLDHTSWKSWALTGICQIPQPQRGPKHNYAAVIDQYYQCVVNEITLNCRRNDQVLLGVYHIRRDQIKRRLGQYTANGQRLYWLNWFEQQPWSLYTIQTRGSNLSEENTAVTLNFDFLTHQELKSIPRQTLIDHYDQFNSSDPTMVMTTPLDLESLKLYITRTELSLANKQRWSKKEKKYVWADKLWLERAAANLKQAQQILILQEGGALTQPIKVSDFGRVYLGGINLQTASKTVRHAAMGHCYSIDLNVCSTAWRRHAAHSVDPKLCCSLTDSLIRNKQQFRQQLAEIIGDNHTHRAKQILTAIGFGADLEHHCWPMRNGQPGVPAIREIVNDSEFAELQASEWFQCYCKEQRSMTEVILQRIFDTTPRSEMPQSVRDRADRVQRTKLMAWLYQHAEAEYISAVIEYITARFGRDQILLSVHDCVYIRHSVNMAEVNSLLQQLNPWLSADITEHWGHYEKPQAEVKPYKPIFTEEEINEILQNQT